MPRPQQSEAASPEAQKLLHKYARFANGIYSPQTINESFKGSSKWTVKAQSCNSKTNHWALMQGPPGEGWVLAFRGTQSAAEGLQDAFAYSVEQAPQFIDQAINDGNMNREFANKYANMHLGFAMGMFEQQDQLKRALRQVQPTDRIVVTGHSLGGALANCFVNMDFLNSHRGHVSVFMYGAPPAFYRRCPSIGRINVDEMILVVNGHDPVPRLLGPHNEAVQLKGALVIQTLACAISAHSDYRSGGKGGGKEFAAWMTDERKVQAIQGSGQYRWPDGMTLAVITPDKDVYFPNNHGAWLDGSLGSLFNFSEAIGPEGHSMQDGYLAGLRA